MTEEAEKKLEAYEQESWEEPVDNNGKNKDYYDSLGLPAPKELIEREKNIDKGIEITDEDYHWFETECSIRLSKYVMCIDDAEEGSIIYLSNGTHVSVLEDSDDVNAQIWWLTRSRWEKIKEYFRTIVNKFKNKK